MSRTEIVIVTVLACVLPQALWSVLHWPNDPPRFFAYWRCVLRGQHLPVRSVHTSGGFRCLECGMVARTMEEMGNL